MVLKIGKKTKAATFKAEAAKFRKAAEQLKREVNEARVKEDKYWVEAEVPKSRSATKREAQAKKREEAAARKAETRRLAEEEEKELEESLQTKHKKTAKVTVAELRRKMVEDHAATRNKVEELERRRGRMVTEAEYERTVLVKNTNGDSSVIDASSIDEAIAQMTMMADPMKSKEAFEKATLVRLKEEKPGLTITQYQDRASKLWKRSIRNPANQKNDGGEVFST